MARQTLLDVPAADQFVQFKPGFGTRFLLTVDTEEEFDWGQPFDRARHGLAHLPRLAKFQQFCEGFGVTPVYLIDFPVASDPALGEILGAAVRAGKAEVGVQLHPWVNPPHHEDVNARNSFAGNLPAELEQAKFRKLCDQLGTVFDTPPLIYRAGRYGVGPATAAMLRDAGIAIDSSVRARFDYSSQHGPNYRDHPVRPYWVDGVGSLIELPLTTVFWGMLHRHGPWLHPRMWRLPRLRGALARANVLDRIPLTPEGVTCAEAIRGIDIALDDALPLLVFAFHSPSLHPGLTPYVRDEDDLDRFYDWWRAVFDYLAQRQVPATTVRELMANVEL